MENGSIRNRGSWAQVTWAWLVACAACVTSDRDAQTTTSTTAQEIASAGAVGPGFGCACRWGCFVASDDQTPLGDVWIIGECETVRTNDGEAVDSPTLGTVHDTQAEAADYCNTSVYDPLRDTGRTLIALLAEVHACVPLE